MERVDKILAHPEFRVYMRRIREQERTRVFCLHGIEHSLDVARIGYIKNLEQGLSFRQDVIYAMALLHDIGRCEEYASGKSHHEAGAELARPILLACGYTEHECAEICDAIGRHKAPSGCRIGRSYTDFQKFLETKPESAVVQMDSVIGRVGGKCLLTIHFVETSLMLAFLRDSNTSASVIQIINLLDKVLGNEDFSRLFPVILTDNGSEFSNPKAIEKRDTIPCSRTNVFYCDPSAPYQKGACEVNHELIRRILPKGSSFDELTQQDITLMMNHINSYKRKKLNNRSPYETFSFYYGEDILKKLGCKPVAAENIILKPKLLKK